MDNRRVKFCLKILSRFGKIIRKPQGVKFFGAHEHVHELVLPHSFPRATEFRAEPRNLPFFVEF